METNSGIEIERIAFLVVAGAAMAIGWGGAASTDTGLDGPWTLWHYVGLVPTIILGIYLCARVLLGFPEFQSYIDPGGTTVTEDTFRFSWGRFGLEFLYMFGLAIGLVVLFLVMALVEFAFGKGCK